VCVCVCVCVCVYLCVCVCVCVAAPPSILETSIAESRPSGPCPQCPLPRPARDLYWLVYFSLMHAPVCTHTGLVVCVHVCMFVCVCVCVCVCVIHASQDSRCVVGEGTTKKE
jgi:hypothetical protein